MKIVTLSIFVLMFVFCSACGKAKMTAVSVKKAINPTNTTTTAAPQFVVKGKVTE